MTYHFNSKIVGIAAGMPVQAAAGLGAYTGYNTGPVGKEIVARGGGTSSSDLKAYASAGAGAGGAALCTAYGGAAVAPLCAQAASAIAEILLGHVGSPATAGAAYTLVDQWNATRKIAETAADGAFKVRAYLAMRDQAIDDVAKGSDTVRAWADKRLSEMGLPAAPIRKEWAPRQDLWDVYKATAVWAQNPIGAPPSYSEVLVAHFKNIDFETMTGKGSCECEPWGYGSPTLASIAKKVGLAPEEMLTLLQYRTGPMADPAVEPINFGMVGAWEVLARNVTPEELFHKKVRPPSVGPAVFVVRSPPKVQNARYEYQFTNGLSPAQEATALLFALQEAKVKLQKEASVNSVIKVAVAMSKIKKAEAEKKAAEKRKAAIAVAVVAAGAAAGGWWWWKRRR